MGGEEDRDEDGQGGEVAHETPSLPRFGGASLHPEIPAQNRVEIPAWTRRGEPGIIPRERSTR